MSENNGLSVPDASSEEELRQLAICLRDLHEILNAIHEKAENFLPGEEIIGFRRSWPQTVNSLQTLRRRFPHVENSEKSNGEKNLSKQVVEAQLTGNLGAAKRSLLGRLRDRFYSYWYAEPLDDLKRKQASSTLQDYLDFAGTVVGSFPFSEQVVEVLGLTKQLVSLRHEREWGS